MPKIYHLYASIVFAVLALLNVGVGVMNITGGGVFWAINFLIATYIGFRSYEEYKVYNEK